MLRFQHQEYFVFLLLVGVAVLLFFGYQIWRNKKINLFGKEDLVKDLMPSYSGFFSKVKFILLIAALFVGVVGLANLQKRGAVEKIPQKGIDVMIALDVSNSMYAQDLSPSRLEKEKLFTDKLIDKLRGNRIGLVLFAGRSYLSVPLTSDVEALKMNLSLASPENLPTQGTVIGDALQMSLESFNNKDANHKAVVLISDGEDHEEKAISEAKKLGEKGIMLCTVGVGSDEGSTILLPDGNTKKDRDGQEVISKMNATELKNIADAGQGIFVNLSNIGSDVNLITHRLDQISKTNLGDSRLANYSSYFQIFLAIMLVLLIIEFFMPSRKPNRRLRTAFHTVLFMLLPQIMFAQVLDKNISTGNDLYKKEQYEKAAAEYQKTLADKKAKTKEPARFNLGNAFFRGQNGEQALKQYDAVGTTSKDNRVGAAAYHNAGNVHAEEKKWQEAINYYKASLKKNPSSAETKYNLAYAQKKLKDEQNKKDDKKDDDKDNDKKQEPEKPKDDGKPKDDKGDKEKNKKPEPQPSKLSKEQAKKLLDALSREEKKVKDEKEKGKAGAQILDKDW